MSALASEQASGPIHDVVVIGGGPAGATAAALLARAGHDVVVLERDRFPRFHIGESLLPAGTPVLERLGVDLSPFLRKQGADFVYERDVGEAGAIVEFSFANGLPGTPGKTWQVLRAPFDAMLLERARAEGAEVRAGVQVDDVELGPDEVAVSARAGEERLRLRARYVVDASGQRTFLGRRQRSLAPSQAFGRAAVYSHYTGLTAAHQAELARTGNIQVILVPNGWAWGIPLRGGALSVGFVRREGPVTDEAFEDGVAGSPILRRLTAGAVRAEVQRVGDFSYLNVRSHGPRYVCVGDAACFLDPVFSSGVSLGLIGAARMTDTLSPALRERGEGAPDLMAAHCAHMERGYLTFAAFIHRFYTTRLVENLFFHPRPDSEVRRGIVSVLAGDVWRDDNPFQEMLLAAAARGRHPLRWPPPLPGAAL